MTAGRPERAESIWTAGRSIVPPDAGEALDMKRSLALLYYQHQRLDPDAAKFYRLEQEMFIEKGHIIAGGDTEAVQRFHTTLALIYAERNVMTGPRARNAQDQARWALLDADRRDEQLGWYQPLPELRAIVASSAGNTAESRRLHAVAAAAFLVLDDLAAAEREAAAATASGAASALRSFVVYRQRVERARSAPREGVELCAAATIDAALRGVTSLTKGFADRQRFKVLADCVEVVPAARQSLLAAEALRLVADRRPVLVAMSDVVRIDRAMTALLRTAAVETQPARVSYATRDTSTALTISLPAETRPGHIALDSDVVIAAHVIAAIGAQEMPYRFSVVSGEINFQSDRVLTAEFRTRIRGINGVKAVRVLGRPVT
jgi:hypothetical protein